MDATAQLAVATAVVAALATVLLTVAQVLWFPIDMGAIERADDAGWDENLLLPHQFALDAALMGAWVLSVAATVLALLAMRRSRPWLLLPAHVPPSETTR